MPYSITLLINEEQLLPFNPDKYDNVQCIAVTDEYWRENAEHFQDLVVNRLGTVTSSILTNKLCPFLCYYSQDILYNLLNL